METPQTISSILDNLYLDPQYYLDKQAMEQVRQNTLKQIEVIIKERVIGEDSYWYIDEQGKKQTNQFNDTNNHLRREQRQRATLTTKQDTKEQ